ncbi:MAG: phosphotransferase [bacterium]|nr:aminoglycoside phosphotransferase [Gammaproteobacteria bacterium]HIL97020.1 aminoglycoside phosphotransferase [Pseudomonadales bacterium]
MDDPNTILQEVTPCLAEWNIKPHSICLASHSENIVYKVTAEDESTYALRVHRPGYHSLAELNAEQVWTQALSEFGLQVPVAYPTSRGEFYVAAKCGGVVRQVALIGWLEGQPLADFLYHEGKPIKEIPLEMISQVGVTCAQLHNHTSGWQPPAGFTRHSLNVEGLLGADPFWGRFWEVSSLTATQRRTIKGLRNRAIERLTDYGELPKTYSMIHADLHEGNLFVTNDGLVVIDFDDAGFGWHQYDLAVALFSHSDRPDFDAIEYALIEGYRTQRSLSDEDASLLTLFTLIRNLALIGWANARPELERDEYLRFLIDKACRTKI